MKYYTSNVNENELKNISLKIKCIIIKKPGISKREIIYLLNNDYSNSLINIAIRLMRNIGTIIIRDGKHYALGPSIAYKTKRQRYKQKEIFLAKRREL